MTIQEAIKSGKPFKRPQHDLWLEMFHGVPFYVPIQADEYPELKGTTLIPKPASISADSILATDWQVMK
jgi:hypothetical protein